MALAPRARREILNMLIGSWEMASSVLTGMFAMRFLLWPYVGDGRSPFDVGLFSVMQSVCPYAEVWGGLMLASIPFALWASGWASVEVRLLHRVWLALFWGMFAGATLPLGVDTSITTFGVLLLWGLTVVSILQVYALLDQQLSARDMD